MEFKELLGENVYDEVWDKSHDVVHTGMMLSDIYDSVPSELDCFIEVLELHMFPEDKKDEILEWLERQEARRDLTH